LELRKLSEYLKHADECRRMARTASPAHREQLENMATTWTQLAEARKRQMEKQSRTETRDRPPQDHDRSSRQ
jgi:hypothetical protein